MKLLFTVLFCLHTYATFAADPAGYLKTFDSKIYSLKSKGVKDFVVDIESPKLTKQMNDQAIFGKIKKVIFKTYWTANPERLAIEIEGLPEGFKEIKEELKASLLTGVMDGLIPQTMAQKFAGYKFLQGKTPKEVLAQDTTGLAQIPSFTIKFNAQDILEEIIGHKPVGEFRSVPKYEKDAFAEGKLVLKDMETTTSEQGQSLKTKKEISYSKSDGIGVVSEVNITTEQKSLKDSGSQPLVLNESITFKNYKINNGDALKYFLGERQIEKQ